jgi:hypothetical protein
MRKVRLADGLLEVEGGALNSDIFAALRASGQSIVHGRCGAVGISAYIMGGGVGLAMRDYGLGCDQVDNVELVLANGQPKTVSASAPSQEDKELFWAVCGGGGGNLGFVTKWWLRTQRADDVVAFRASWKPKLLGKERDIFTSLVRALEKSPKGMGAQVSIFATTRSSREPNQVTLTGQLRGNMNEFQDIFGPIFRDNDLEWKSILRLPYWLAQDFLDIHAVPNRYQETSVFADKLTDDFIVEAFNLLRTWPGTVTGKPRVTFFLMGGRVNEVGSDATAFVHRSSQWLLNPALDWTENDNQGDIVYNLKWQRDLQNGLASCLRGGGSYQNFPDPELNNHARAYWDTNYQRLAAVKLRVDPDLVFTPPRNQGITP